MTNFIRKLLPIIKLQTGNGDVFRKIIKMVYEYLNGNSIFMACLN